MIKNQNDCNKSLTAEEINRIYEIKNLLKNAFSFNHIIVGYADEDDNRLIECSYDGVLYGIKKIYAHSPDHEIIYVIKDTLFNRWDELYTVNATSRILSEILSEFFMTEAGYCLTKNILFKTDDEVEALNEIVDTNEITGFNVKLYDSGDLEYLEILTTGERFILTHEDCTVEPLRKGCRCR